METTYTAFYPKAQMQDLLGRFSDLYKQKAYKTRIPYEKWRKLMTSEEICIDYANNVCKCYDVAQRTLIFEDAISNNGFAQFYYYDTVVKEWDKTMAYNDIYTTTNATITTNGKNLTCNDYICSNATQWFDTTATSSAAIAYDTYGQLASRIEKLEEKKENKNMKFHFDFGPVKDCVHMSMYGMAIKNKSGNYVSYDPATESIIDVDILNFEGANKFMYKMPVPIKDIAVGDIIVHNGIPCFVRHVPDCSVKTFEVIDPYEGEMKEILIPKSMFGFDYATKVVNLMEGMFGNVAASTENPFGNMLPLLMLNDGAKADDMLPLMLMMNQNTNMFSNPMMMYMLMKDNKNFDPMMLMLMMNQDHTCKCGGSCGGHDTKH